MGQIQVRQMKFKLDCKKNVCEKMAKEKFYKIQIDTKSKAPEIKTESIKFEKLSEEQKKEFYETKVENKGKAAWLMPSGSIFWTSPGTEINSAKKIIFKKAKKEKKKVKKQARKKTKKKK